MRKPIMAEQKSIKKRKVALWVIFIMVVLGVAAQLLFTNKVKSILAKDVPAHIHLEYGSLGTNVLLGSITLDSISFDHKEQLFNVQAKQVKVSGLGYWALLTKGDISISDLSLDQPVMVLQNKKKDSIKTPSNSSKKKDSTIISIENFSIKKGKLEVLANQTDSTQLSIQDLNFSVSEIQFSPETAQNKIPFTYNSYELSTQKLYYDMGPYEFLQLDALQFTPEESLITNFVLRSKYSRDELSKKLLKERDHFDLAIHTITLDQFQFGYTAEESQLHIQEITLQEPYFQVYRDKLLPDDTSHKKLYNQALRDLPLNLQVDTIAIKNGTLTYEERLEPDVDPHSLRFTELSAHINNLHSKNEGKVHVNTEAQLMGDGHFTLDWSFDPQSKANNFLASGTLSDFETESINPFLKTNLRAEVTGTVNQMYFTISGNEVKASGDMKMNYDQFEFVVLKKDRLGVNKLLTAVVNIFARKNSDTDPEGYRYGYFEVERNTDKSFFNYLWINLKAGLLHTVTGSGKKKNN